VKFDALDEPMYCDRPAGAADTQALRYIRCEVCGARVFGEPNGDEPPVGTLCGVCDHKTRVATADLLVKGSVVRRKRGEDGGKD
jgi:hypothetical protein